ncbi:DUF3015 domain-containing protein [Rheinheimera sp. UJ51]|uniref:DUF3015 family protein n=1 Tax=unclassified Rheinheimera TaxID=115860 RepID=UPI001E31821B|nr:MULTISPECIES: DUF3015 family protein [unclassified Rheinheimera]MCC5450552.1 DUF3015 domain-containing protein [Rheinheimera sp. UJ51]MCF4008788.1 DUF3015 domain-containing protein [Rheinheimera sp. UJ63]
MKLALLAASVLTLSLVTAPTVNAQAKVNPWKQCGIGAMIFDDNGTAAALSNIIWDLGTTAVSSNISSQGSCEGIKVAAAEFINSTITNIEEETVIGEGEHLTAMLNLMGCEASVHQAVIEDVRADLDLSHATSAAKAEAYYLQLDNAVNSKFAAQCQVI